MKKALAMVLGAAALALTAGPAFALTAAHMSSATGATQGDCSKCHIPHKALGAERLFPIAIGTASQADYGFMGTMCAEYCHNQVGTLPRAYALPTALANPGSTNATNSAHGLNLKTASMPPDTVVPTSLPYGDGNDGTNALGVDGNFECTTCHDPHKNPTTDSSQALLQEDIDTLCDTCHTQRGAGDGTWAGYGPTNDTGTSSSHPVGANVTGDNDGTGNSPIDVGGSATVGSTAFDVAYGAAGDHNLGGHMVNGGAANTGGVGCVTCHAVHGSQADPGASQPAAPTGPFEDLLVISQGVSGTVEPAFSANGQGDAEDALCSGCHMNTVNTPATAWNPGGTPYSHPVNGNAAAIDWGAIVAPTGWPTGDPADVGTNLSVALICETCHDPHGAAEFTHILRTSAGNLCTSCHSTSAAGHHPVGAMTPFSDDSISGNDGNTANLTCGDCHAGDQGGAHNWAAAGGSGIALASNWEPANNGRGANLAAEAFVDNTSKECIDCHTNGGTRNNPVDDARDAGTLEPTGDGSHYVGASTSGDVNLAAGRSGAPNFTTVFNSTTTTWTRSGWSRYGGADANNYEIVCESCHDLEPDKNGNAPRLLLEPYVELEDVTQNALCVGCHGVIPGGSSVHPLTGQTVSAAVDDPTRAGNVLLITALSGFANQTTPGNAPNGAEYPATANRMTCDSCHQVHMAVTAGGSYILETGASGGTGLAASVAAGVSIASHDAETSQGINHAVLCTQCHAY